MIRQPNRQCVENKMSERIITTDRDIHIPVGDGASMTVPRPDWLWKLNYVRPEPPRGTHCDDRMLVVSSLQSYLYLIEECDKEEAWRRIELMRVALSEQVVHQQKMSRTEEQIVDDANELARDFYSILGYEAREGFRFDLSAHPQEQAMWRMACHAFEKIHGTDVEDALETLNDR